MRTTRRNVLKGGGKAIAAVAVLPILSTINPVHAQEDVRPDPLREGVQALVNEIRQGLNGNLTTASFSALQQVADRLEALPGIQPLSNEHWDGWKTYPAAFTNRDGWRTLRPPLAGRAI